MAICPSDFCEKKLNRILKMSMVPLPCQECKLNSNGCITSESIEWLLDLKGKLPIWSRLNVINTSGYNRKLPMAMTKSYDIEINGRLWSLWGQLRCKMLPVCDNSTTDKPFLAATVMALCAARVFRLNIWTSELLDTIAVSGERYLKESLKNFTVRNMGFQLEDLACECSLEGIHFHVCIKTCQQGRLYSVPFKGCANLAFALINFLACNQFGIVECFNRYLGFGYIKGTEGGYFMFDAQSMNYPLFRMHHWAPYLLRTNHLQILLYCLIVSLNVPYVQANFCIHNVKIDVIHPHIPDVKKNQLKSCIKPKRCLPQECWATPPITSSLDQLTIACPQNSSKKDVVFIVKPSDKSTAKYHRALRSLPDLHVENCVILPMADVKEDLKEKHDFVKMICSETVVPQTMDEKLGPRDLSFVKKLPEALFMR